MLRLTRGSEVEVLSKKVVDVLGAWVCAEVINSTAYTCTVRYGGGHDGLVEETVPRGDVRPLPPPFEGAANFNAGDIVECCHSFSWKTAKILVGVTDNNFLVRLLGVSDVGFVVHKSFLRVRQLWTGADWYVLGKISTSTRKMKKDIDLDDEDSDGSYSGSTATAIGEEACSDDDDSERVASIATGEEEEEGNESEEYSLSRSSTTIFGALLRST
ncbi:uncharacterized protein LOC132174396 [Corylus avellana]|uniref:uncharacterized protein LOC132174396 n=1 Tax=Corylus avellana TaxID=13451 RepID=UPI00286CAE07|nr:uncharacterized protein LOC132174396 [Corylus avellana]